MSFFFSLFEGSQTGKKENNTESDSSDNEDDQNDEKEVHMSVSGSSFDNDIMHKPKRHKKNSEEDAGLFMEEYPQHPMQHTKESDI